MNRYRLPESLGGGEFDQYPQADSPGGTVGLLVDEHLVFVATGLLTKVGPAEPPVGSVVLFAGEALQRFEDKYDYGEDPARHWAGVGSTERYTWARLLEINPGEEPIRLTPAPEPIQLPLEVEHDRTSQGEATSFVKVDPDCSRRVRFGFYNVIARAVDPMVARRIGDAFHAAADEASP